MFKQAIKKIRYRMSSPAIVAAVVLLLFGVAYALPAIDGLVLTSAYEVERAPQISSKYTTESADDLYIDRQWGVDDANLDVVWNAFKSEIESSAEEVFVIVMEPVVNMEHEDLQGAFVRLGYDTDKGRDLIGGYAYRNTIEHRDVVDLIGASDWKEKCYMQGSNYSDNLHGSHIAGIVGARHNNIGIAGCSPKVKIIPLIVSGGGEDETFDWILGDLYNELALRTGGTPRIIIQRAYEIGSESSDVSDYNSYTVQRILYNYKRASDAGLLVVHGAGNTARNLRDGLWEDAEHNLVTIMPACAGISADNLLSVSGHDSERNLNVDSCYSTAGPVNAQAHLSAPGKKIVSLGRNGEYWVSSGTSMAAPHVSGTAALLWQLFPDATAGEIRELILEGAKVSNSQEIAPHAGEMSTTIGGYVRTGFLDAAMSVKKSKEVLGAARGLDIEIPVKKIEIASTAYGIVEGDTAEILVTTILPYTADNKDIVFNSNNPSVAHVSTSGGVHTLITGAVTDNTEVDIIAIADDGHGTESNKVTITVTKAPVAVTSIAIKHNGNTLADYETIDIEEGDTITLEPEVTPANASVTDGDFTWEISPLAYSEQTGRTIKIRPDSAGTYTVTLKQGAFGANCRLNVTEKPAPAPAPAPDPDPDDPKPTPAPSGGGGGGCSTGPVAWFAMLLLMGVIPTITGKKK